MNVGRMQLSGAEGNLPRVSYPHTCDTELSVENKPRKLMSTLKSSQPIRLVGRKTLNKNDLNLVADQQFSKGLLRVLG